MAKTSATILIESADLLSDNMSLSANMNLYKGGTTSTGLEQMNYHRAIIPTGTNFDLIEESDALKDNSNYVYIINKNTEVTDYVTISINSEIIGKLYAGDWLWMPWNCDLSAAANDSTIELRAYTHEVTIEYALFHIGETLVTAADA
jgi:hypothetical protein